MDVFYLNAIEDDNSNVNKSKITYIIYNKDEIQRKEITNLNKDYEKDRVADFHWIDIVGTKDVEVLKDVENLFNIHPLVIEDIQSPDQRLKIDYFDDYLYLVLKSISDIDPENIEIEQISLILGKNYLISLQEKEPNLFDPIIDRLISKKGRLFKMGVDYLLYKILDLMIDNYFAILEKFGEKIGFVEDEIISNPSTSILQLIYHMKQNMFLFRKTIWPFREALSRLLKKEGEFISDEVSIFYQDVYDHIIQVIDNIEIYREMLTNLLDIYLSSTSFKMNEVMKVLTIIATIFIPLTFIAGIYGMNFFNMPELTWKYGYLTILLVMLVIGILMVIFFKKKKWF